MKTLLASLLLAAISASSLHGQSPAPASLSKAERDRAIEYLKATKKDFLASLEGVSDAQWKFKAAPEKWSIAETAEHIAVTEDTVWQLVSMKMMKSPATPEKAAEVKGKDELILEKVPDRSHKAQAPEMLRPTGRFANKADLIKAYNEARDKEIAYLGETKEDLRSHFEEHPAFKTLDAYQWLLLNGAHCKRHTAQILEVKADPNYPKS